MLSNLITSNMLFRLQLISCSHDTTVKFWNFHTGYCDASIQTSVWLRCLDVSPDGRFVATGGNEDAVFLFKLSTGEKIQEMRGGHEEYIQCLKFCRDAGYRSTGDSARTKPIDSSGALLLASGARDSKICIWNVATRELLFTVCEHSNWVNDVAFTQDGRFLISCGDDRTVKVIDMSKRRKVRNIQNAHMDFVTSLATVPSLGLLISGGADCEIRVFGC